jgi:hypothetical protein
VSFLDGVVEFDDLINPLGDCLAEKRSKGFEMFDVCLGLIQLVLKTVLGLLLFFGGLILLLVLTLETITASPFHSTRRSKI